MSKKSEAVRRRVESAVIPDDPRQPIDEFVAAKLLGKSVHWMRRARWAGNGPEFIKIIGGSVRYRLAALEDFIQARTRRSTSDTGQVA